MKRGLKIAKFERTYFLNDPMNNIIQFCTQWSAAVVLLLLLQILLFVLGNPSQVSCPIKKQF